MEKEGEIMINESIKLAKLKLQNAQKSLEKAESEYEDVLSRYDSMLEDIQSKIHKAELEVEKAKKEYGFLLEQLADERVKKPKNNFEKKFYQAARFCNRGWLNNRNLDYVKVEKDRMIGCNGFALVVIRCDEIPDNLIDKLVSWDETDLKELTTNKYLDVDKIINDAIQNSLYSETFSNSSLLEKVKKTFNEKDWEISFLNLEPVMIAINKKYLEYAIECFEDTESYTVSWKDEESAVIFKNNNVTVLIMPIRFPYD